ncbi:YggS family pyridoxal phosphate-dependent enzyme [Niveibacterium sp. SC-1]|uniref:YggS family pyridoxal phosphate-dependent enzyme n=1 Tax=Niveibacterium sp. SC-1 TaxID=3135646 RepID=UPI00311E2061
MTALSAKLQAVRRRIADACQVAGRDPASVRLLAVSKTFPAEAVRELAAAGQAAFGENYAQEGAAKVAALESLGLEWHFIGPLQSNKTRTIANHFSWVHSLEREKIADRLSEQRDAHLPPLNVCIQVNVSGEASKSGVAPEAVLPLARHVETLPRLRLRGLMAIPEPSEDAAVLRARFAQVRRLREQLADAGLALDTLSMGMSADLEAAIAEGATLVRVGSALFGVRPAPLPAN